MTFNSLICKIFEPDKKGDVSLGKIVELLFYSIIVAVIIITYAYGSYLNLSGWNYDIVPLSVFLMLKLIAKGLSIALSLLIIAGVILIIWYEGAELWNKIKNKPVAHCSVKKEEDDCHD